MVDCAVVVGVVCYTVWSWNILFVMTLTVQEWSRNELFFICGLAGAGVFSRRGTFHVHRGAAVSVSSFELTAYCNLNTVPRCWHCFL